MKVSAFKKQTNKGEAGGELILIASVVLILGVLWALSGGPERAENKDAQGGIPSGKSIISGIDSFFIPIKRESENAGSPSDKEYDRIVEEFGRTRDFGETSPHWGLVTIEKSSSGPKQSSPQNEYVTLDVSSSLKGELVITGWKLQSMISNETDIFGIQ